MASSNSTSGFGLLRGDLLGGLLGGRGGGEMGSLLDANRDGNPLDDILRMAGKTIR